MNETIWEPLFISATFTPHPAAAGNPTILSIVVVDVFGKEQAEIWYCGEIGCGEV